jgi:hypothetical protein
MKYRCHRCFFKTDWEDNTGKFPICERMHIMSLEEAKAECAKPGVCPHYTTRKEAELYIKENDNE